MQPGPDKVIACPKCSGLARVFTLLSGNTFGALLWTDGYSFARMLPEPPLITRCAHCQAFFWTQDARKIGEIPNFPSHLLAEQEPSAVPEAWRQAPEIRTLSAQEYLEALAAGAARTAKREADLRVRAWWRYNDAFRDFHLEDRRRASLPPPNSLVSSHIAPFPRRMRPATPPPQPWSLSPEAAVNLERLIEMLDPRDDRRRLKKAEAWRELGQFARAESLLLQHYATGWQTLVQFMLDLTRERSRELREVPTVYSHAKGGNTNVNPD